MLETRQKKSVNKKGLFILNRWGGQKKRDSVGNQCFPSAVSGCQAIKICDIYELREIERKINWGQVVADRKILKPRILKY